MRSDIADLKTDMREIRQDLSGLRTETQREFAALRGEMSASRSEARGELSALREAILRGDLINRMWMLLLCGAMLGVMARGFHWI